MSLWRHRQVLYVLARKDFLARFRRTSLGMLWAIGLPVVQAVVLTFVFTRVAHIGRLVQQSQGQHVSYAVFIYSGIVTFSYFSATMPTASTALVDNVGLAGKIYFPRLMLPLLVVVTSLYPLAISLVLLLIITVVLQHGVGFEFLYVVPGVLLAVGITAGFGLALSALHVYFRDVKFIVQAAMSVLFYATPVIYSLSTAPPSLSRWITYGPMTGPIELMRMATVGADPTWDRAVLGGIGWFVVLTSVGLWLHSRYDRVFVDRL